VGTGGAGGLQARDATVAVARISTSAGTTLMAIRLFRRLCTFARL
jgi:hypothetical protein